MVPERPSLQTTALSGPLIKKCFIFLMPVLNSKASQVCPEQGKLVVTGALMQHIHIQLCVFEPESEESGY